MTQQASSTPAAARPVIASADALKRFASDMFVKAGAPAAQAGVIADVLVWANLRGMDTHGVTRIPRYLEIIAAGDMNPNPAMMVTEETPAMVQIEADRAIGAVGMSFAMDAAIKKAKIAGIGLATVRSTTHAGAIGYYTLMAAHHDMVGIAMTSSWANMAYHGARAAGASTNPLSIAVPGGRNGPIVLDMATGIVAMGRLVQARKNKTPIPPGWALDKQGLPTTDPAAAHIPLPMSGAKGSGLSLMIELITSVLVANPLLSESIEGTELGKRHRQNGLVLAIDISRFGDPAAYAAEVERLVRDIKGLPVDPDTADAAGILMPGERGEAMLQKRSREGVPIPPAIYQELKAAAQTAGVTMFDQT
jgi:LDH2 family malate/lactate/ureidoglycolate dehydrogenase